MLSNSLMAHSQIPYTLLASTSSPDHFPSLPSTTSSTLSSSVSYLTPPLSSETPSSYTRWEVFLSFCGQDTRNSFTDYVYDGLKKLSVVTYRDDPELVKGDNITEALKKAIEETKIYVVVFSENYASSSWCLDELVEIYKYHQTEKRLIIAVYYKIEPAVVRHQLGSFKKAFKKHKSRADPWVFQKFGGKHRDRSAAKLRKIDTWRRTLTGVAGLSGATIPEESYKSEADIVNGILDRIQIEINPKTLHVADHPVGLVSGVREITTLLSTEGVTKIGIYGMGGVGKTTLAKAVYNQNCHLFESSCFLKNVRECSVTDEGKLCLQQQLINNILKSNNIKVENTDRGTMLINHNIPLKRVLIVVDDLDDLQQLKLLGESFASGSKIIITTRNEDLLDSIGVGPARYKVHELGDANSRELFTKHTRLGDIINSPTFTLLCQEILQRAGGLPKALTTFGDGLMNEESDQQWWWFIDVLDQDSNEIIHDCLLISYNGLKLKGTAMLQNIFLDIACLYIGQIENVVVEALAERSYKFIKPGIDILKKRSLLTISDRSVGMHILLLKMARRIRENSRTSQGNRHDIQQT